MLNRTSRLAWAVLLLVCSPALADVELFVSPTGDDAKAGTKDQPVATLERARDIVRVQRGNKTAPPAVIHVAAGTYRLARPIVLSAEDGNCTWRGEPGRTVISGGQPVGPFVPTDGGLWSADVPDAKGGQWVFNELFVNGQRRPRARHPNSGYLNVVKAGADNRTNFTFKPGDLGESPPIKTDGAEIVLLHDWSISRTPIARIDPTSNTLFTRTPIGYPSWFGGITGFGPNPRYFLENHREWLDAPGEWFLDTAAGKLLYKPIAGETLDNVQAIAPQKQRLMVIAGDLRRKGALVEAVRFEGINFEHCLFTPPSGGYAPTQAGYHQRRELDGRTGGVVHMPAAVEVASARGCTFDRCTFTRLGGSGLRLGRASVGNRIVGCTFDDVAGNGVMVGEDGQVVDENVVERCVVRRCGQRYFGCVGVWVGLTRGTVVRENLISELPYSGVSVGWSWNTKPTRCADNIVRDNEISRVMLTLSDGGGIYTLGRQPGTQIVGNRIHDIPPNAGRAPSNGMFIDEGSSEFEIRDNVIWNLARSPIRFHKAENLKLIGNTLVAPEGEPPFRFNVCKPEQFSFKDNKTPKPAEFTPPPTSQPAR